MFKTNKSSYVYQKIDIKFNVTQKDVDSAFLKWRLERITENKEHWSRVGVETNQYGQPIFREN